VDSSPAIGVGHAMRCAAIAEYLQEVGFKSVFIVKTSLMSWLERHIDSISIVKRVESEANFDMNSDVDILVIDSH
jgi:spore coat polysaccharide biosynthesis predicted glycosyltransferase SpsG